MDLGKLELEKVGFRLVGRLIQEMQVFLLELEKGE